MTTSGSQATLADHLSVLEGAVLPGTVLSAVVGLESNQADLPSQTPWLPVDQIYTGDSRQLLSQVEPSSVALSVWSPPYFVGKSYEKDMSFQEWKDLLREVILGHFRILKPGAFLAVNIADILCFKDNDLPKIQAANPSRHRVAVTREDVLKVMQERPGLNRYQIAEILGCSEQTVDRRLKNNNIRGGKYSTQTRVKLVGGLIEEFGLQSGLYLYDRRVWVKDPAWENGRWHTISYRSVDEFEYLYIFWKPGITKVDRSRLTKEEWIEWGSRGVWNIPSVRANDDHEAKFPLQLPRRIIRLLTDPRDVVLDCFVGSGTTAVAAVLEGRHFMGMELNPGYADMARIAVASEIKALRDRGHQYPLL